MSCLVDFIDVIVKQTDSITVTARLLPKHLDGAWHFSPEHPISHHVECRAHGTIVEIDAVQAFCVEDSIAFCVPCLTGAPPIVREPDPMVQLLRDRVAATSGLVQSFFRSV